MTLEPNRLSSSEPILKKQTNKYRSWGNHLRYDHQVFIPQNEDELARLLQIEGTSFIAYGNGKSFGDACLNANRSLIDTQKFNQIIAFDPVEGIISYQSGVLFKQIIHSVISTGWFVPVVPSTQYLTIGGAIANDVHGRDHHSQGTFGKHLIEFELMRSNGERLICSPFQNTDLFNATIGGLGLTGFILSAKFKLKKILSPFLQIEKLPIKNLDDCVNQLLTSSSHHDYSTAWLDGCARGKNFSSGMLVSGSHIECRSSFSGASSKLNVPFDMPGLLLNDLGIRSFNRFYNAMQKRHMNPISHYEAFLYQLDKLGNWNRLYGRSGIYSYHFVLPLSQVDAIHLLFEKIKQSKLAPYFVIVKTFGDHPSPGKISFPMQGIMAAIDFAGRKKPHALFHALDEILLKAGGRIYLAKDCVMKADTFIESYPEYKTLLQNRDPVFSSSLSRRIGLT